MQVLFSLLIIGFGVYSKASSISSWLTTADPETGAALKLLEEQPPILSGVNLFDSAQIEFTVDTFDTKQKILGYGAGLPQSSAYVLYNLKKRDIVLYNSVIEKLFGFSNDGAAINILRFPIGSCDFSMNNTSYDEYKNDYNLEHFAIDDDSQMIVTVLKDALTVNPSLVLIATPWSPPSWLKTWDSLTAYSDQNTLLSTEDAYNTYAKYFSLVLQAYRNEGITIQYFTLQNEPLFGTSTTYPGMYFTSQQATKLGDIVRTLLGDQVKILAYDHNWDEPSYPLDVLAHSADPHTFAGTAWHCYGGDMATAMDMLQEKFPGYEQHVTECTGSYPDGTCDITKGMTDFGWNHEWDMRNVLLGAAAHWSSSGVKWVIALDETCGPVLPGVTFTNGRPLVSIPSDAVNLQDIVYNQDYYSIKHMSRYLMQGRVPMKAEIRDNSQMDTNTSTSNSATNTSSAGSGSSTADISSSRQAAISTGREIYEGTSNTVRVNTITSYNNSTTTLFESFYHNTSNTITSIILNTDHENDITIKVTQGQLSFTDIVPKFGTKIYQWTRE